MARKIDVKSTKTFATEANVIKAVEKANFSHEVKYIIQRTADGRFFPIFIGDSALRELVHTKGFNIVV